MDFLHVLTTAFDFIRHVNVHLGELAQDPTWGPWIYVVLFTILFCETGLVVTPFLPGDSLIFAVGALAGDAKLDPFLSTVVLFSGGVIGNTVNYHIGHYLGPKVLTGRNRFLKKEHLDRTHAYFEKYGAKTVILAQFVPIVRTFAPFVAGVGAMTYWRFLAFNVLGATLWVGIFMTAGFCLGRQEFVKKNFGIVEVAIIAISLTPMVVEWWRVRRQLRREAAAGQPPAQA
ncbi:MAG: VTT domain-containing protein [Planctomycetota bacterium]|nr:VTT domain-containing protein [Planctomycetota bacterium]